MTWNRKHKWSVQVTHHNQFRVSVVLNVPPSASEIVSLRKLVPEYAQRPLGELQLALADALQVDLGLQSYQEATDLKSRAEQLNLRVEVVNVSYTSYLPVDESNNSALLIEDQQEAERVAKEMIASGAKVHHVEVD